MQEPLHEFFAVLVNGEAYRIDCTKRDNNSVPLITKIAEAVTNDNPIGYRLEKGHYIHLTRDFGIMLYELDPGEKYGEVLPIDEETSVSYVNGVHTKSIVGLFESQSDALSCLLYFPDLHPWEWRWGEPTQRVLRRLGGHGFISISPNLNPLIGATAS